MLVYLNPGHDRKLDSGAVNTNLNLRECDLAWRLGEKVRDHLVMNGMQVILRQSDDLNEICRHANQSQADVFVSLHFNAFNTKATGTETLISYTPKSLLLGHCIQSYGRAILCLSDRGIKERNTLCVIRGTAMPACILETCFIDNDSDIRRYLKYEDKVARAIAAAIMRYPAAIANSQHAA